MPKEWMYRLYVDRPAAGREELWRQALPDVSEQRKRRGIDIDSDRVQELADSEPPGVALYQIVNYINEMFSADYNDPWRKRMKCGLVCAANVWKVVEALCDKLGWRQREAHIGILRLMRRSTKLSLVLGAGTTIEAGGPSWAGLVLDLVDIALGEEHEVASILPDPNGTLGEDRYVREIVPVPKRAPDQERELKDIRAEIGQEGDDSDTEVLMRGAQICHDLFGQHLLKHICDVVYSKAPEPGPTLDAIAEVASHPRVSRGNRTYPAWHSVVNYNFDSLLCQALDKRGVPRAAFVMEGDKQIGYMRPAVHGTDWHQTILHLHGFVPSWKADITHTRFVFSASQYAQAYGDGAGDLIALVRDSILSRPPVVTLYVGCSFNDEQMNKMLGTTWWEHHGRMQYALLKWPRQRAGREPTNEEVRDQSLHYLNMGVQPIWYDDHNEIPDIIRSLL
jgi:hypothetical protein